MFYGPFRAFRPRHPLARLLSGVLGIIAVLALIAVGMFALAALAIGGGLLLLVNAFRSARPPAASSNAQTAPAPPGVIEGEFTVIQGAASTRDPSTAAH
ncbi:hypothetical protein [Dokdonella soli]|uniref:Uncharacterized protein n=1 Tax=Dokdonella soli TaxID=529810 RepID=A0ABN1ILW6_9GAMM